MTNKVILGAIIIVLILGIVGIILINRSSEPTFAKIMENEYAQIIPNPSDGAFPTLQVQIDKGDDVQRIAQKLYHVGLLSNEWFFTTYIRLYDENKDFKYGYHLFRSNMNLYEIIKELQTPRPDQKPEKANIVEILIPEGKDLFEIAAILESKGIATEKEVVEQGLNSALAAKYDLPNQSIEGFLFPDTYQFYESVSVEAIFEKMIQEFFKRFPKETLEETAQKIQLEHWYDIVTLASIVEKEVARPEERQAIANIYWSRLVHHKMNLESCPTAFYSIKLLDYQYRDMDFSGLESCRNGKRIHCDCAVQKYKQITTNPSVIYNWRNLKSIQAEHIPQKVMENYLLNNIFNAQDKSFIKMVYEQDKKDFSYSLKKNVPNEDRVRVSSVINRIKYDLAKINTCRRSDGFIDWSQINSAHNTYIDRPYKKRLPPTPICNPGKACIESMLQVEFSEYKYFRSDGKGGSLIAKTSKQHQENTNTVVKHQ